MANYSKSDTVHDLLAELGYHDGNPRRSHLKTLSSEFQKAHADEPEYNRLDLASEKAQRLTSLFLNEGIDMKRADYSGQSHAEYFWGLNRATVGSLLWPEDSERISQTLCRLLCLQRKLWKRNGCRGVQTGPRLPVPRDDETYSEPESVPRGTSTRPYRGPYGNMHIALAHSPNHCPQMMTSHHGLPSTPSVNDRNFEDLPATARPSEQLQTINTQPLSSSSIGFPPNSATCGPNYAHVNDIIADHRRIVDTAGCEVRPSVYDVPEDDQAQAPTHHHEGATIPPVNRHRKATDDLSEYSSSQVFREKTPKKAKLNNRAPFEDDESAKDTISVDPRPQISIPPSNGHEDRPQDTGAQKSMIVRLRYRTSRADGFEATLDRSAQSSDKPSIHNQGLYPSEVQRQPNTNHTSRQQQPASPLQMQMGGPSLQTTTEGTQNSSQSCVNQSQSIRNLPDKSGVNRGARYESVPEEEWRIVTLQRNSNLRPGDNQTISVSLATQPLQDDGDHRSPKSSHFEKARSSEVRQPSIISLSDDDRSSRAASIEPMHNLKAETKMQPRGTELSTDDLVTDDDSDIRFKFLKWVEGKYLDTIRSYSGWELTQTFGFNFNSCNKAQWFELCGKVSKAPKALHAVEFIFPKDIVVGLAPGSGVLNLTDDEYAFDEVREAIWDVSDQASLLGRKYLIMQVIVPGWQPEGVSLAPAVAAHKSKRAKLPKAT